MLFTLLFLAYYASLWFEKLANRSRLLEITSVVGFCAVVASALSSSAGGPPLDEALVCVPNFLFGTIALGAAMTGMLLGHWYLVTPELSLVPIKRLTGTLVGVLVAQGVLLALTVSPGLGAVPPPLLPRVEHLLVAYPYFLLGRALVGAGGNVWVGGLDDVAIARGINPGCDRVLIYRRVDRSSGGVDCPLSLPADPCSRLNGRLYRHHHRRGRGNPIEGLAVS